MASRPIRRRIPTPPPRSGESRSPLSPPLALCEQVQCVFGSLPKGVMPCEANRNIGEASTNATKADKMGRKRRLRQQWAAPCPPNPRLQRTHQAKVRSRRSHCVRPTADEVHARSAYRTFFESVSSLASPTSFRFVSDMRLSARPWVGSSSRGKRVQQRVAAASVQAVPARGTCSSAFFFYLINQRTAF